MSTLLTAVGVLAALLGGAYLVAVLDHLSRPGPRHVALAFTLPLSEALGLLRQEDLVPRGADGFLFRSAPLIALAAVALAALVIPLGPHAVGFDPTIGLFYFIVVLGPFVVAMMNAGWSQNSKEGLFGTFRAAAHLIAYEVPLGFAAIGPVMDAQSLSTVRIVQAQSTLWYGVWQPLGLLIYLAAMLMVSYRHPFDIPQGGSELEDGVFAEYAGSRLLLLRIALDALFIVMTAMAVVLFLGGWRGPLLPGPIWFLLKTALLASLMLWVTRYVPRLRQDQMLGLAWKVLLPATFVNLIWVGVISLLFAGGRG